MVVINEGRIYFLIAFIVLALLSILVNSVTNKKYSGLLILITLAISFYISRVYIKQYKPFISLTYFELYNLKKDYSIKEVMMNPKVLFAISAENDRLIQSSNDYESYIGKTSSILSRLKQEIGIKHENQQLDEVASISILVSTMFGYGNPPPHADRVGCLSENYVQKNTGKKSDKNYDYSLLKTNRIGCCSDYAYIISKFLTHFNIKNRLVIISGHVFNEFKTEGSWHIIDANTGIMATKSFTSGRNNFEMYYLPHFGMMNSPLYRPVLITFREFLSNVICDQKIADGLFMQYTPANEFHPY